MADKVKAPREMPQYQPDYIISWDFSKPDHPCIVVSLMERDTKDVTLIKGKLLGVSYKTSGVISLRQIIEHQKEEERREKERREKAAEILKQFKTKEGDENDAT